MMRILRIFLLFAFILLLLGCVRWIDREESIASKEVEAACRQKCAFYENNQGVYTYKVCFKDCMSSKGFEKVIKLWP